MLALEPVKITVSGSLPSSEPRRRLASAVSIPPSYFFNKLVRDSGKYEEVKIRGVVFDSLREMLTKENQRVTSAISEVISDESIVKELALPIEQFLSYTTDIALSRALSRANRQPQRIYIRTVAPKALIVRTGTNMFSVVANNKSDASRVLEETKNRFEQVAEIAKDFGLKGGDFLTGSEYTTSIIKSQKYLQSLRQKESKNDFETEAQQYVGNISSSAINNAEIEFSSPNESFEYDTISALSDSLRLDLEFKDFEYVKEELHRSSTETWKSRIILTTGDKATRLGATPIIVVKGFPDDIFKSLKELGDSRRIDLLSSSDYQQALPNLLFSRLIHSREFVEDEEGRHGIYYSPEGESYV